MTQRLLPLSAPDENITFSPEQLAKFALHETLWRTAWGICMDPSPSVTNKLDMLHLLSTPEYRTDPAAGAAATRQMMARNDNHLSYQQHMGRVLAGFDVYAAAIGPEEKAPAAPAAKKHGPKQGYSIQSREGDIGF